MTSKNHQWLTLRSRGDGDYDVISWRTDLPSEPWASLREMSAADVCRILYHHPEIEVKEIEWKPPRGAT